MTRNEGKPLVSVVIPNFNYGRYLDLRIQSVLKQTFHNFELILLDDASVDNSLEILKLYGGGGYDRISHIVLNDSNSGNPFVQWHKGIQLARGKYVWIAEADDLCEPTFLENVIPLMETHRNASVCFVGNCRIDQYGTHIEGDFNKWKPSYPAYCVFDGKEYIKHNLYWRNYIDNASAVVFRKNMMKADNIRQCEQMRHSGDWLFWFYMAMNGDVIECYKVLNYFRQHPQKVTVKATKSGMGEAENMEIVRIMEQYIPNLGNYRRRLRRGMFYNRIAKMNLECQTRDKLYELLREKLGGTNRDGRFERFNRVARLFCPFVLTMKRDRLRPSRENH